MGLRVAIVGGRDFRQYYLLKAVMDSIHEKTPITAVICGCAAGADTMGSFWADEVGIKVEYHKPKWDDFGRSAGLIRNCEMLKSSDKVVAFWNGFSHGTGHMIDISRKENKLLHVEDY